MNEEECSRTRETFRRLAICHSCGHPIPRLTLDPYLDAYKHLADCSVLQAAVLDWSLIDDAEDERRERM